MYHHCLKKENKPMTKILDARDLACPAPVLMVKNAVEKEHLSQFEIIVDNEAAKENVSRFLGSQNFDVTALQEGNDYKISARRQGESPAAEQIQPPVPQDQVDQQQKIMVLAATDRIGTGDDELGQKLMISFIKTLEEMGHELWRLVFVNNGVKLTIAGSAVLNELKAYEDKGLTILVCGTCLSHFNLLEAKQVGTTTNMLDIVTAMQLADKVISI
jgi:selenium metabolism protein YedF